MYVLEYAQIYSMQYMHAKTQQLLFVIIAIFSLLSVIAEV